MSNNISFIFRMNSRLNTHLFWSAINLTASLMLRFTAELIGSFLLLFVGIAAVYFKADMDPLWAGNYFFIFRRKHGHKVFLTMVAFCFENIW